MTHVFVVKCFDEISDGESSVVAVRSTLALAEQFIKGQGNVEEWRPRAYEHSGSCVLWAKVAVYSPPQGDDGESGDEAFAESAGGTDGAEEPEMSADELRDLYTQRPSYSVEQHEMI